MSLPLDDESKTLDESIVLPNTPDEASVKPKVNSKDYVPEGTVSTRKSAHLTRDRNPGHKKLYNDGKPRAPRDGSHYKGTLEYATLESAASWVKDFIKEEGRPPVIEEILSYGQAGEVPFSRGWMRKNFNDSIHCFLDAVEEVIGEEITNRGRLPGCGDGEFGEQYKIDRLIERYETAETNPSKYYPLVDEKVVICNIGRKTVNKPQAHYKIKATLKEGSPILFRLCPQLITTKEKFLKRKLQHYGKERRLLDPKDIHLPKHCPYLKHLFNIEPELQYHGLIQCVIKDGTGVNGREDLHAPSLDKDYPPLGYVPGNVEITSWFWNRMKGSNSRDHLLAKLEAKNYG